MADALRILLVEDDEDDYVLTRSMLGAQGRARFELDWEQSYRPALRGDPRGPPRPLPGRLPARAIAPAWSWCATRGTATRRRPSSSSPARTTTRSTSQATELGVTDYLVKGTIDAPSLERTIRYARPPPPGDGRPAPQRGALRRRRARDQRRDLGLGPADDEHALLGALEVAARLRRRVRVRPARRVVRPRPSRRRRPPAPRDRPPPRREQPALRERAPHPPRRRRAGAGCSPAGSTTRDAGGAPVAHHRLAVRRHRRGATPSSG